ncbi:MAG TPA: hypothetical protein VNY05_25730 [Candidatus Acidoferrales bacterium]|jgi:hypothetical protein|nr:hypothetical protein [Candidatus Acidoferrales bacterium]
MKTGQVKLILMACLAVSGALAADDRDDRFTRELDDAARVASVMVDGDVCGKIVTARAMDYMLRNDPKDRFLAGDNYEVNYDAFDTIKKTLIRISRLVSFPADANVWMPVPGHPDKIRVVIRNANELSQFWPWGALYQNMIPEMKTVLDTGRRVTVAQKPGWVSVLAPAYDSLGDIVAVVEVASQRQLDPQGNVK